MKEFRLDSLDMKILDIMETDCTKSYREISEQTGKDLWTVRDRVVLLKRRGIIKGCRAEINYSEIGLKCRSLIIFNLPEEKIDPFISFAKNNHMFKRLSIATGQRRFFLEVVGNDCGEVREYARKVLPKYGVFDVIFEVILDIPF
jgi:DNA-binding Lrp family transcriptional regulator